MSPAPHYEPEDLTLFALGALPPEETSAVAAHVHTCDACRGEVALVNTDLANLALTVPLTVPPPAVRQRFMARVENEASLAANAPLSAAGTPRLVAMPPATMRTGSPQPDPLTGEGRVRRGITFLPWAIAAGFAIATVAAGIDNFLLRDKLTNLTHTSSRLEAEAAHANEVLAVLTAPNAQHVALSPGKTAPQPSGRASYLRDRGQLLFTANNLAALPAGKVYELWIIPPTGAPVPAGVFSPDTQGSATLVFPDIPKGVAAKAFGVTIENEGGSPVPTSPVMLQGS